MKGVGICGIIRVRVKQTDGIVVLPCTDETGEAKMSAYIIVVMIFAMLYTFYMGFSDGANAVATCVATRAIKARYALIIAGAVMLIAPMLICYFLRSDSVARTVGSLVYSETLENVDPKAGFVFMLSTMIAALVWSVICVLISVPNSTSHTLLGGLVGAAIACFGFDCVNWTAVGLKVILMVFLTPLLCLTVGFILDKIFREICVYLDRSVKKYFKAAQVVNVVIMSTSISINNVQKTMGIYLLTLAVCQGVDIETYEFSFAIVALISVAIMTGIVFGGYRLIYAVGKKIYRVGTLQSFTAQVSTAAVALTCSFAGIPISTGQVVSSSIIGVGIAERVSAVRWGRAKKIFSSWILTFPVAACVGALVSLVLKLIFIR